MSRMRAGKWGILVASVIRKAPERLHEPLTQILLSMDNLPFDHVVDLIQISEERKLLEDEKKEDENKRETTH
jgi:hypothetical protein